MTTYLLPWLERQKYKTVKEIYPNIPAEKRITKEDYAEIYNDWCNSSTSWRESIYLKHQ